MREAKSHLTLVSSQNHPSSVPAYLHTEVQDSWTLAFTEHFTKASPVLTPPTMAKIRALGLFTASPTATQYDALHQLIEKQGEAIQGLTAQVAALTAKLDQLVGDGSELVDFVDPDFATAVELARKYFKSHKEPTYPDELATAIGISVGLAVEVCEVLVSEGYVVA